METQAGWSRVKEMVVWVLKLLLAGEKTRGWQVNESGFKWADGFGLYWSQRDSSTLVSTVALVLVCLLLVFNLIQAPPTKINLQKHKAYQLDRKGNRRMQRPFYCMPLFIACPFCAVCPTWFGFSSFKM